MNGTPAERGEIVSEPEYVDPRTLRPGPIRNESLPPELLEQIKAVFDVIGPYTDMTLERFEVATPIWFTTPSTANAEKMTTLTR